MTQPNRPLAAAGVIFCSMAVISLADSFFFHIVEVAGLWQFHLVRALLALPLMLAWSKCTGTAILPKRVWPVLARGLCVSGAMIFYFGSLAYLTVPQAAAGLFTSPLWMLLLTAVILRQGIAPRRIAAITLGFLGALLVLGPSADGFSPALGMPIAGGLLYALGAIATRQWCEGETALTHLAAFFFCMIFWGLGGIGVLMLADITAPIGQPGFLLRAWGPMTGDAGLVLVGQTFVSVFVIYGLTRAYQLAEATYAAVFEYSFLVFAAIWAAILFANLPTNLEGIGIAMILISGLLIALSPAARTQT